MPGYTPANLWVLYIMSTEIVLKYKLKSFLFTLCIKEAYY